MFTFPSISSPSKPTAVDGEEIEIVCELKGFFPSTNIGLIVFRR